MSITPRATLHLATATLFVLFAANIVGVVIAVGAHAPGWVFAAITLFCVAGEFVARQFRVRAQVAVVRLGAEQG